MNSFFHNPEMAPYFFIGGGVVLIILLALTMRSIVRRDKAMVDTSMDEPHEIAAYQDRWRGQRSA
ncbi:MAG: hypothetical protein WBB54_13110 [Mycobacterium sp.]